MQLSSWRDRRAGVGYLMGRDISPQYQHRPNSRRDSNAAEFLEGQEVRGWPPHGEGRFLPPNISIDPTPGGRMVDQLAPPGHHPFLDEDERKVSWEVLNLRWRTHSSRKDQFCNGFKI